MWANLCTECSKKPNMGSTDETNPNTEAAGESWFQEEDLIPSMPQRGELRNGVIASISPSEIFVDVSAKSEGIIPKDELEWLGDELSEMKVGQEVRVFVVDTEDRNGNILLSIRKARELADWEVAEKLLASQEVFSGTIGGHNKGGLIVTVGQLRGFIPASQISADRRRLYGQSPNTKWNTMNGESIMCKVVEVDARRNRLILSERAAGKEIRAIRKEQMFTELEPGKVLDGRVISVADFGIFVSLGGADGLVHVSELTWEPIAHPSEKFKVGQQVKVEVLSVDAEHDRIALSTKRLEQDPWQALASNYKIGQLVRVQITRLTNFGAFARLAGNEVIEGLVHISELSGSKRINHPKEVLKVGQEVTLRVIKIDPENRRIGLSLKEVESPKYAEQDMAFYLEQGDSE